eukprot:SAG31_NODE_43565_length_266_cov_1.047904_1_plen_57_part_10
MNISDFKMKVRRVESIVLLVLAGAPRPVPDWEVAITHICSCSRGTAAPGPAVGPCPG